MPYELFLALRYLRSRRRGRIARVTAVIAATTIAIGVAALIIALALAAGFQNEMRDKILRGTAHVTVARRDSRPIADWRMTVARVRDVPGVVRVSPTSYAGALLVAGEAASYTVLRGVDPEDDDAVNNLRRALVDGSINPLLRDAPAPREEVISSEEADSSSGDAPEDAIIIGAELAARTSLRVGDRARVVVPTGERSADGQTLTTRTARARIAGIFRSDLYEYDATWSYVSLRANLAGANESEASVTALSVEVADIYAVARVEEQVRAVTSDAGLVTVNWQEANRPLFAALELERRMVGIIIALIITIAALNITTTLALVVIERRADIAILSAMGARARSIMLIFLIEGATLGALGAAAGVMLGLIACFIGDRFQLVRLPADVYSISHVPLAPRARDVLFAASIAFVISLLATLYPARTAARTRPAESLRSSGQ